jgi:hypothetical protein
LRNLIWNEPFARKVLPFVRDNYFTDNREKTVYRNIESFITKYNALPTREALLISVEDTEGIRDNELKDIQEIISTLENNKDEKPDENWLIEQTEKFCQEKAVYNAVLESITILDGKTSKSKGAIPQILSDALSVSFDPNVGHDYLQDYEMRYEFYHRVESKIPFDLDFLNKITGGGVSRKTLNILLAGCVHPETEVKIRYRKKE